MGYDFMFADRDLCRCMAGHLEYLVGASGTNGDNTWENTRTPAELEMALKDPEFAYFFTIDSNIHQSKH